MLRNNKLMSPVSSTIMIVVWIMCLSVHTAVIYCDLRHSLLLYYVFILRNFYNVKMSLIVIYAYVRICDCI